MAEAVPPDRDPAPIDQELELAFERAPHVEQAPSGPAQRDRGVEAGLPVGVDGPRNARDRTCLALTPSAGCDEIDPGGPRRARDGKLPTRGRRAAAERSHLRAPRSCRRLAAAAQ